MREKHQDLFKKFTATFTPQSVSKWEEMVKAWEFDHSLPNPFEEPINSECPMFYSCSRMLTFYLDTTERQIRRLLAEEEEADAARGVLPPHKVTPSSFLSTGLDLEEQQ